MLLVIYFGCLVDWSLLQMNGWLGDNRRLLGTGRFTLTRLSQLTSPVQYTITNIQCPLVSLSPHFLPHHNFSLSLSVVNCLWFKRLNCWEKEKTEIFVSLTLQDKENVSNWRGIQEWLLTAEVKTLMKRKYFLMIFVFFNLGKYFWISALHVMSARTVRGACSECFVRGVRHSERVVVKIFGKYWI